MSAILRELRGSLEDALGALGRYALFAGRLAAETPRALLRFRLVVEQVHNAGALSLVIIMLSGLFVGMVLGLQGYRPAASASVPRNRSARRPRSAC